VRVLRNLRQAVWKMEYWDIVEKLIHGTDEEKSLTEKLWSEYLGLQWMAKTLRSLIKTAARDQYVGMRGDIYVDIQSAEVIRHL